MWTQAEVRELKVGRYMLIDEEPCKILSIDTSKPGKHGEARAVSTPLVSMMGRSAAWYIR
jgi:translation elongation factor P/translation initiation factor 5A